MEEKHCKWYKDEFCTNGDSPCVADYCPVVEYPELCKCREVDKDINVRSKTEEKILTDEEIVKAILQSIEYSKTITYFDEWGNCKSIMVTDILTLIHRLQNTEKANEEAWEIKEESYKRQIAEQKAEIERLTKDLNLALDIKETISSIGNKTAEFLSENENLLKENVELQKQVDELKKKLIARESVFHNLVIVEKDKSVKLTAKEILILAEDYNCGYESNMDDFMQALKERYGVEVE